MEDISEVLHFIQKTLKAPKNQFNKHGGYNYRSCEDIIEAIKQIMPEGAYLTISDDIVTTMLEESYAVEGKTIKSSGRVYIKATATLWWRSQSISNSALAREDHVRKGMDSAQLTGATSSYARKYALNGLFMIDDQKDADATNDHGKAEKPKPEPKAEPELTPAQKKAKEFLEKCSRELKAVTDLATLEMWEGLEEIKAGRETISLAQKKWLQDKINEVKDRLNPLNAG